MSISLRTILAVVLAAGIVCGRPAASAANQYLLLNCSPDGFSTRITSAALMDYIKEKFGAANQTSSLKAGVACLYYPGAAWSTAPRELALLRADLARAQKLEVPILVQVDVENWLPRKLLNWYDPRSPGYDPKKVADVEWFGWNPETAVKLCWRNWGREMRVGPAPNYLSGRFQAYEKQIYKQFLPVVVQWQRQLPADEQWLFVGWRCGWESSLNGNYRFFANGNSYYGRTNNPKWSGRYQSLGYNAARTAGIKTHGVIDESDIAKIVGRHLTYLAKMAFDAGVPRGKIFVHGTVYGTARQNRDALVNPFSNPGASFYGDRRRPLKADADFMEAVHAAEAKYHAKGYAYGEFNLFTANPAAWRSWFNDALCGDTDCVYQALYNYDSVYGKPSVAQALLDVMAAHAAPGVTGVRR